MSRYLPELFARARLVAEGPQQQAVVAPSLAPAGVDGERGLEREPRRGRLARLEQGRSQVGVGLRPEGIRGRGALERGSRLGWAAA